jgi:hypothetical protein
VARSDGDPLQVVPTNIAPELLPLGEAKTVEAVSDELKTPKVNGFAEGEATTRHAFTIGGDNEH